MSTTLCLPVWHPFSVSAGPCNSWRVFFSLSSTYILSPHVSFYDNLFFFVFLLFFLSLCGRPRGIHIKEVTTLGRSAETKKTRSWRSPFYDRKMTQQFTKIEVMQEWISHSLSDFMSVCEWMKIKQSEEIYVLKKWSEQTNRNDIVAFHSGLLIPYWNN